MNKNIILIFIIGTLSGIAISFLLFSDQNVSEGVPRTAIESKNKVSLMVDTGKNIIICPELQTEENTNVFELLNVCAEEKNFNISYETYEGAGVFVTEIADGAMDDSRFWQFWVNNQYAQVSADNFPAESGDIVMWKLTGASIE